MQKLEKALEQAFYRRAREAVNSEEGYLRYCEFCSDFYRAVFIDHHLPYNQYRFDEARSSAVKRAQLKIELAKEIWEAFH